MAEKAEFTEVNEHFEAKFNAATASKIVFQQPASVKDNISTLDRETTMTDLATPHQVDKSHRGNNVKYSICTLLTDWGEYKQMLASFVAAGFSEPNCEFLYVDNSDGNTYDAFQGINRFFCQAQGDFIILCHQDIRLTHDQIAELDQTIDEISQRDPHWALLGNAGGSAIGQVSVRITDPPHGSNVTKGPLPARVMSLDENFILVRRSACLGVSRDLEGFHLYGTELCMIADILGYRAYVVDFHLTHLGGASQKEPGEVAVSVFTSGLETSKQKFIEKYKHALRPRWIQTTCTRMQVSGSKWRNFWLNKKFAFSLHKRVVRFSKCK